MTHFVSAGRDITEEKEQEEELRPSRNLLHIAGEMTGVGGWATDLREGPPYQAEWTEKLYDIFGVPKEEDPPTEEVFEYYHPEDRNRHRNAVARAQETGEGWDQELRLAGAEEEARWVRNIGHPVEEDGEVFEIQGAVQDITRRKWREERLKEAKEEAERMNRLKSAFLANMSHEIRTPLTSILGFAEAIDDETQGLEPPVEAADLASLSQFAGLIKSSGQRLMEALTGVLNLSKLEAGEMTLSVGPVDLAAEAEETAEEFRSQAEVTGIELHADLEGPAWAEAGERGLHMVLQNLLSNAIKHTEEGGQVWVRMRAEGNLAVLEVEDTGIGMDPAKTSGLFEAFKQASEGTAREYEGMGLGLTLVREILDRMDGSIEVET